MPDFTQTNELIAKANEFAAFETKQKHTWCNGCGDYGILSGLTRALVLEEITPDKVMLCYDVGCNGNASDKIGGYTIHGLHGRVTALAAGIKLGNPKLEVIASAGDGATFSEGINHLIHAVRCDYPITFIVHNNNNYGLTIGQASSTTKQHYAMNGSPDGPIGDTLNTLQLVLSLNPSFVARSFSGDVEHITKMIRAGINHPGFSYIEIMQACPTFNKNTPQEWYWDKIRYIENIPEYDPTDIWKVRKYVDNLDTELVIGVLYQNIKPHFVERLENRKEIKTSPSEEVFHHDISELMQDFM